MTRLEVTIDPLFHDVLRLFAAAARQVGAPWLVVGATARILLLERVYGLPAGLATQDVDFAVQMEDWKQYEALRQVLLGGRDIEPVGTRNKRFRTLSGGVFDLLPYGGVEVPDKRVLWPPDGDSVMTVRGFPGAARAALTVRVNDSVDVPVANPAGLCALKLFAWEERGRQEIGRDAKDIAYLFRHIGALYPTELLYEQHAKQVEAADYDMPLAALRVLGGEVAGLLEPEERKYLCQFMHQDLDDDTGRLARDIGEHLPVGSAERPAAMLRALFLGIAQDAA